MVLGNVFDQIMGLGVGMMGSFAKVRCREYEAVLREEILLFVCLFLFFLVWTPWVLHNCVPCLGQAHWDARAIAFIEGSSPVSLLLDCRVFLVSENMGEDSVNKFACHINTCLLSKIMDKKIHYLPVEKTC